MVTCPLVPNASRLISGFCSSPCDFALDFLRTPPRGDALALWLAFGSTSLAPGLSPGWIRAMHGTHVEVTGAARLYRAASVWTAGLGV